MSKLHEEIFPKRRRIELCCNERAYPACEQKGRLQTQTKGIKDTSANDVSLRHFSLVTVTVVKVELQLITFAMKHSVFLPKVYSLRIFTKQQKKNNVRLTLSRPDVSFQSKSTEHRAGKGKL